MSAALVATVVAESLPTIGVRVRVSDASPHGFTGRVTAVHPGAVTVARDDSGASALVILSRRRVMVLDR
jgi:hypothetical protein